MVQKHPTTRKPAGYEGIKHETIGSDIIAVLNAVRMPEVVLGEEKTAALQKIQPNDWYPIQDLIDLMNLLEERVGPASLRKMGRALFALSHQERVLQVAKSARDIIYGIDGMYHHANRGHNIGGWKVTKFLRGYAELEKNTPHHCIMEEGILSGAFTALKVSTLISQKECFRQGADKCVYVISTSIADKHWDHTL
jgi:hypothetical protein